MPSPRHPAPAAAASLHCWGLANGLGQTDSSSGWRSRAQPAPARARLQFVTRVRDRPTRRRVACFQAGERDGPARPKLLLKCALAAATALFGFSVISRHFILNSVEYSTPTPTSVSARCSPCPWWCGLSGPSGRGAEAGADGLEGVGAGEVAGRR